MVVPIKWYAIHGYEGLYEVSNTLLVRSVDRWVEYTMVNQHGSVRTRKFYKGSIKKNRLLKGELITNLSKGDKMKTFLVKTLLKMSQ